MKVTPWEVEGAIDYGKLIKEFGMQDFSELIKEIPEPHRFFRRGIVFGHRDYDRILAAMRRGEDWAVMSGFMPSGMPHLGHKMTMEEIVWHQKMGGRAFVAIADIEANVVRGLSKRETFEIGMLYVKSIVALGLREDAVIYFQSASQHVKDLALELAKEVNFSELRAVYGFESETSLARLFIPAVQAADILHPQLREYGGPKPVVVPVGADQDPHIRLTRDVAARASIFAFERIEGGVRVRSRRGRDYVEHLKTLGFDAKFYEEHADIFGNAEEIERAVRELEVELGGYAFVPPSATYHRFVTGLTGGKMSSSKPESYISLFDPPEVARRKVMNALTGGRATAEEQRRFGGEPERCVVFELYKFHLIESDNELDNLERACRSGEILCGGCKKTAAELLENFLREFREKVDEAEDKLGDYTLIAPKL
ncbi:MAG: tryptophan--tRNA ligase [Archaeoglobaceae archaeon]